MDMEKYYRILIDTNIFFLPFQENFDSINELKKFLIENNIKFKEFITLRKNIWEIENKLNTAKSEKYKKLYKTVLEYIKRNDIKIIDSPININTDRLIIKYCIENDDILVCTRDSKLIYVLRKLKISYIKYSKHKFSLKIF